MGSTSSGLLGVMFAVRLYGMVRCGLLHAAGTMALSVVAVQNSYCACVARAVTWFGPVKATSSTTHCLYGETVFLYVLQ